MSWKEKMQEFGGGDLTFLSEDGEVIFFRVVGEPVLLSGKYKNKPSEKIGCPVVTLDGFVLFVIGKRLARKLAKHESQFTDVGFEVIRHGAQNDITSTYELKVIDDADTNASLFATRDDNVFDVEITEAVDAAQSAMQG